MGLFFYFWDKMLSTEIVTR